jgi:2-phosphoglycolate phosphatase
LTRLYVFDLDGTLVDSLRDLADSASALLVECGAPSLDEGTVGPMVGEGAATLVARLFRAVDRPQPDGALDRFLAIYESRLLNHTRPYDGIPQVLEDLASRAALAVLTNKPIAATRRLLAGLDLDRFFADDAVMGGDGPFPRKPDPSGLRELTVRAGVPAAETMLVGDSAIDWRTARNAGTRICLARYGFGFQGVPLADLTAGEAVIDSPRDLLVM